MVIRWGVEKIETSAQLEHLLDEFAKTEGTVLTDANPHGDSDENIRVWRDGLAEAHRIAIPVQRTGEVLSGAICQVYRYNYPHRRATFLPSHPAMGASEAAPYYMFEFLRDSGDNPDEFCVMHVDGAWLFWDNRGEEADEMYSTYDPPGSDEEWHNNDPVIPDEPAHHPYDGRIAYYPGTNMVNVYGSYNEGDDPDYACAVVERAACHARMPYWTMPALLIESRVSFDPWKPKSRLTGAAYLSYAGQAVPQAVPAGGIDETVERFQAWWDSQLDTMGHVLGLDEFNMLGRDAITSAMYGDHRTNQPAKPEPYNPGQVPRLSARDEHTKLNPATPLWTNEGDTGHAI